MRTISTALFVVAGLLFGAAPASALSCAELPPYDMVGAIESAEAAAIGTVVQVYNRETGNEGDGTRLVVISVGDEFKGDLPPSLVLIRHHTVWGPYYQPGDELAMLMSGGLIDDGQKGICGPFYSAELMRDAGGEPLPPTSGGWLAAIEAALATLHYATS